QERLLEIRRSLGIETRGRDTRYEIRDTSEESAPNSYPVSRISYFSEPLSNHLRAAAERRAKQQAANDRGWLREITNYELRITNEEAFSPAPLPPFSPAPLPPLPPTLVKVFPDIALAMLRTKTAAAGRVWLLLRHLDAAGRGRVAADEAARLLTGDGSATRICGRRQLANLLRAGEGLFWERDAGRHGAEWLRLHSAARVAAGLGVARLGGSPVAVPLAELTGTIGRARAHLYAAFHSGRTQTDLLTGERRGRGPISREALCKLSGAAANSQRNYERRARVGRRKSIAIGPAVNAADAQETAWQRGRALFRYHDRRGRHGRPGAVYLAWQLPNEYTGPHDTLSRGSVKRLNRSLSDLFHNGITGNGGEANYELRITNYELGSGQWTVNSRSVGQCSVGQCSVGQGSVGQGSVGQSSVVGGRSTVARQYYNSAKGAHGARHAGERYWRHGGVWLWQPEIRDTKYEIRVQTNDERALHS
ncbi:MAG TPA: hypothetical protein PK205_14550, partial [Promineifilum sp.]|nr:hypothetical protein [Promineifilum sp.]